MNHYYDTSYIPITRNVHLASTEADFKYVYCMYQSDRGSYPLDLAQIWIKKKYIFVQILHSFIVDTPKQILVKKLTI